MTTYSDQQLNESDLELLSAYIDQQLSAAERAALEGRLESEPALRLALDELRATVGMLRELPPARPPRSFALDPAAVAPVRRWSFPWMQISSALVAATLLIVFGFVLARSTSTSNTASAPMAAAAPTAVPGFAPESAAVATSAPAAAAEPAPTQAAAAAAPTAAAQAAAGAAPAGTAQPPAILQSAPKAGPQPTEAPAPSTNAAAQPAAPAGSAGGGTANDATGAASAANQREAATLTTQKPAIPPIAASGNTSPDTRALEQAPAATPQPGANNGQARAALFGGIVVLIVIGIAIILLFSRRRS